MGGNMRYRAVLLFFFGGGLGLVEKWGLICRCALLICLLYISPGGFLFFLRAIVCSFALRIFVWDVFAFLPACSSLFC